MKSEDALLKDINKEIKEGKKMIAAKRLQSGDVVLAFATSEGRTKQEKEKNMLKAFEEEAQTKRRLFAMVAHKMKVSNVNTHRQEEAIKSLYEQNANWEKKGIEVLTVS